MEKKKSVYKNLGLPIQVILLLMLAITAFYGYSGDGKGRLGPPLGELSGQDFRNVLHAALAIQKDESPYALGIECGKSPNLREFATWEVGPYVYPPLWAVLVQPLLGLPENLVLNMWSLFSLSLLALSAILAVWSFSKTNRRSSLLDYILVLTLFFLYAPTQFDLKLGQVDILMLFLLMLTFWLYQRGSLAGGFVLSLAIAIKPILLPMIFFFIWKREWRFVFAILFATGMLTLLGFFVAGWKWLPDYLEATRQWSSGAILAYPVNQSIRGLALRLFANNVYIEPQWQLPILASLLPTLASLAAIAIWLLHSSRENLSRNHLAGLEFGLSIITIMLISPLTEDIHFVWALLPLSAFLLSALEELPARMSLLWITICFCLILYLGYPALGGKIYSGYESLFYYDKLVASNNVFFSGLYLYGLLFVHATLVLYIRVRRGALERTNRLSYRSH